MVHSDTPFRIASISKAVTALTIMRFVRQISLSSKAFGRGGILDWDGLDSDEFEDERVEQITVRHLLTHTAGGDSDFAFDRMFITTEIASDMEIELQRLAWIKSIVCCDNKISNTSQARPSVTQFLAVLGRVIKKSHCVGLRESCATTYSRSGWGRMYLGSTLLSDTPDYESEYFCPGCGLFESVFPDQHEKVTDP